MQIRYIDSSVCSWQTPSKCVEGELASKAVAFEVRLSLALGCRGAFWRAHCCLHAVMRQLLDIVSLSSVKREVLAALMPSLSISDKEGQLTCYATTHLHVNATHGV